MPFSMGLETVGGVMTKLIEGDTTIPARKAPTFTICAGSQSGAPIQVFEDERDMTEGNDIPGEPRVDGILLAARDVHLAGARSKTGTSPTCFRSIQRTAWSKRP